MDQKLGQYQIRRELGRGAMGIVYLGFDEQIERYVAIKTIALHAEERDDLRKALLREARAAGQLNHPNIVIMYQVGEQQDQLYLVMEYVAGGSLDRRIQSGRPSDTTWTCRILRQVALALDAAHAAHLVHRDIKPSNILLAENDAWAKVADFGLARTFVTGPSKTLVAGTPSFMSPEQTQGADIDGRSDQFALAVLAYRMLTGKLPFEAENIVALAYQICKAHPAPAHMVNPLLPHSVSAAIARGLEKQREQRYQSCLALVDAIEVSLTSGQEEIAPEVTQDMTEPGIPRPVTRWKLWALVALMLCAALSMYLWWRGKQIAPRQSREEADAARAVQSPKVSAPEAKAKPEPRNDATQDEALGQPGAKVNAAPPAQPRVEPPVQPSLRQAERAAEPGRKVEASEVSLEATRYLVDAVKRKEPKAVLEALLDRNADPSAGLYAAVDACNLEMAKLFVARGANANWTQPNFGSTTLWVAVRRSSGDSCAERELLIELLLTHGARPDTKSKPESPLESAASYGPPDISIVKRLLAAGAPVQGALRSAAAAIYPRDRDCDPVVVNTLLFGGALPDADADAYGKTALIEAASHGCAAIVDLLLKHKAQADRTDHEGRAALLYAVQDGIYRGNRPALPVVKSLVAAGANVDRQASRAGGGSTPMLESCAGKEEIFNFLLDSGGDPSRINNRGETCLHLAVNARSEAKVARLLARKVNVNARNEAGRTALGEARQMGFKDTHILVRRLLEAGATE